MKRFYDEVIERHFARYDKMLMLSGPRQVGKTTIGLGLKRKRELYYFNWDIKDDRLLILEGPGTVAKAMEIDKVRKERPIVAFDEIHKSSEWKGFLKGFFDAYHFQTGILVTGSARLDVYQRGGDSLLGRYFPYRIHPLSVAELVNPTLPDQPTRVPSSIDDEQFERLLRFGGFPEPFLEADPQFSTRWQTITQQQIFREDLRDLTRVMDLSQLELLAEWIRRGVGSQTTYHSLAKKIRISADTVRRWIEILKSIFYLFDVRPWSNSIPRSLVKEPKLYLYDWSVIDDPGARTENFIASHLLKAVHFWTDQGFGRFGLYYLRDRQKRELDFVIVKDGRPWILIEVKKSKNYGMSPHLRHFAELTKAPHLFQVALDEPYVDVDCFSLNRPTIVPARTFLSQLI